jgi:hypothetical protein
MPEDPVMPEERRERDSEDERESRPRRRRQERDDYDDRPRRRRREPEVQATDFLIPTNVSAWSIGACYFGLFSCFLPIIGFLMASVALIFGIIALRQRKKGGTSYGSVTGDVRAIIGVVCSSLTLLGHLVLFALILANQ